MRVSVPLPPPSTSLPPRPSIVSVAAVPRKVSLALLPVTTDILRARRCRCAARLDSRHEQGIGQLIYLAKASPRLLVRRLEDHYNLELRNAICRIVVTIGTQPSRQASGAEPADRNRHWLGAIKLALEPGGLF